MSALSFIRPSNQQVGRKESTVVLTHMWNTKGTTATWVACFLWAYRCMPHTTGETPAELLLGWILPSPLHLKPAISIRVQDKQQSQKEQHDCTKQREFQVGDPVFVRHFPGGKWWIFGSISSTDGPGHAMWHFVIVELSAGIWPYWFALIVCHSWWFRWYGQGQHPSPGHNLSPSP